MLYFTSSRAGGYGGKDIYACRKLPGGEWGKATNLGPVINTPFDEEAPFIYSDGRTLFFSSNKYKERCCFDNFFSTLSIDGTWTEPTKIGYPVKKTDDRVFYAAATTGPKKDPLYHRTDSAKINMYLTTFMDQKKALFTVLKSRVEGAGGKVPVHVKITVTDNETGEVLNVYGSNPGTGSFILTLPQGRNNNITYESDGCLFQSDNADISKKNGHYEIRSAVYMPPLAPGSKVVLNNVFFDFDGASLQAVSGVELNKLFNMLSENPRMVIELCYYIAAEESSKHSIKLCKDRAEAVAAFLIQSGINKERVLVKDSDKQKPGKSKSRRNKKDYVPEAPAGDRLELLILAIK